MPFREKSAWISIGSILVVYGWYFSQVFLSVGAGRIPEGRFVPLLTACVLVLVAAQVLLRLAVRRGERPVSGDERELMAQLKATRAAFNTLSIAVAAAVCFSVAIATLVQRNRLSWDEGGIYMLNGVVLAYVVAELARYAAQIAYLRRMG